jgi:peptide/nickel transport system substrate-binding protein
MLVLGLLIIASMVLAACTPAGTETPEVTGTEEVTATDVATPEVPRTTRHGGWLDQISMTIVTADAAVTQIEAGAIDIYASNLGTPQDLQAIRDAGLENSEQFGLFYEITYNVCKTDEMATGKLNPFENAKIREASNWLYDRNWINQEIYGGAAIPKFLPIVGGFPDYARYVEYIRPLEAYYAYNYDLADQTITAEMEAMGAEKVGGMWQYNGENVELIILIRTDSDGTRVPLGDYVADQWESLGFTLTRQYGTSSELSPIWILGDICDGLFHMYTGAWGVSGINRDQGSNFQFYYTPQSSYSFSPLWQYYANEYTADDTVISEALALNDFNTLEERGALFEQAINMVNKYAFRVWIADNKGYSPWRPGVEVAYDLAAGVDINKLWPHTLRFTGEEGGTLNWGTPDLFVDPANPVAGSNWTYDSQWQNAVDDQGLFSNPYTGVYMPQRIERAEVTVLNGLPVAANLDWCTLEFADEIAVPEDAWINWDPVNQVFITVGEQHPDGLTAKMKSVVYYPENLYDITFHSGSPIDVADFVMAFIMTFETGMPDSAIFDPAQEAPLASFLTSFKGMRITNENPLTIEFYSDVWYMDAEYNVTTGWFNYGYGVSGWDMIAVANLAEAAGEVAYSADKSEELEVEWMNWLGGPTLAILDKYLDQAIADNTIPYEPTLGAYITTDEAATRYANLKSFYQTYNHFWNGTGPYILEQVFFVEKTLVLINNPNYIDLADKWAGFSSPKLAEVAVDGAARVTIGDEAMFDVFVTFQGEVYPDDEILSVKYLLFDATGTLAEVGLAELVEDGQYLVTLSADTTAALAAGSNKLEVAVSPIPCSIPSFGRFDYIT